MNRRFDMFAKKVDTDEIFGVLSQEDDGAYLVPRNQWEDDCGEYDPEWIVSKFYPRVTFEYIYRIDYVGLECF